VAEFTSILHKLKLVDFLKLRRRNTPKHEPVETPHDLDYDRFRAIETAKVVHSGSFESPLSL
jgi:hypothetical protein